MANAVAKEKGPLFSLPPLPEHWHSLGHAFIHQAKAHPQSPAIYDSTGVELTYQQTLVNACALASLLQNDLGSSACVGILLPPSAAGALLNIALTIMGRVPVNLNYTASKQVLDQSIVQCRIEQIISSSKVAERVGLKKNESLLLLESLEARQSVMTKALAWGEGSLVPEKHLASFLPGLTEDCLTHLENAPASGLFKGDEHKSKLDDPATIIFTAGSTAEPKGVLLSHRNVLSNILAIKHVAPDGTFEVVLGVLPFFHSFGFTLTLWAVLALGAKTVYHHDPFDARLIGKLCRKHKVTAAFCTPTIMRSYLKRCTADDFESMKYCVLGGEPLKEQLAADIQKKLGIVPLSGYGLAETSPVLASNLPGHVKLPDGRLVAGTKIGTVGLPLPGTSIKIVDAETSVDLPAACEGVIMAKGPQIMLGYLNNPDASAKVINDGWFRTGDIGFLDSDGFLTITGRLSQFSKIGGEMVPHLGVESAILKVTGASEDCVAVASIPDEKKGERLAVVHCNLKLEPEEIVRRLIASEISRLWIPNLRDFIEVETLPVLANGKIDRRKIEAITRASLNCSQSVVQSKVVPKN